MKIDSSYLHSGPRDELLNCDASEISKFSANKSRWGSQGVAFGKSIQERQRLRFLNILGNTWHRIVRITNNSETSKVDQMSRQDSTDFGMKSRELLSMLLSCYKATRSEVDFESFNLMSGIESIKGSDCGSIAEVDYLWGMDLQMRRNFNGKFSWTGLRYHLQVLKGYCDVILYLYCASQSILYQWVTLNPWSLQL
ncbi:hypothetical protein NE237_031953 [Protea cynaroides]|uniref:Uncharacterized protein n=1 Tax=Protea cynaroides TaxID=273540 RepID=A0A9Q0L2K5_9MAGN|nr:hypothetical protein NE237_031953 [Protea cynaroides]